MNAAAFAALLAAAQGFSTPAAAQVKTGAAPVVSGSIAVPAAVAAASLRGAPGTVGFTTNLQAVVLPTLSPLPSLTLKGTALPAVIPAAVMNMPAPRAASLAGSRAALPSSAKAAIAADGVAVPSNAPAFAATEGVEASVRSMTDSKASAAQAHQSVSRMYDGLRAQDAVLPVAAESDGPAPRPRVTLERRGERAAQEDVWESATFLSASGDLDIHYKFRKAEGSERVPMVFIGGLALAESYDTLFETQKKAKSDQYFAWLRGHAPTGFSRSDKVYEQDARDMARMIVLAAERSGTQAVDLTLHSYGVLVFQKMVQLHRDLEVQQALRLLKGGKVTMLNATTHYGNSETVAGEQFAQMAKIIRMIVQQLDLMDSYGGALSAAIKANPFSAPFVLPQIFALQMQRNMILALASKGAVDELRKHLADPWDKDIDHVRERIRQIVEENSAKPGWQEAFLRRANDTSLLDFTKEDVQRIRDYGIRVEIIHSADDQLIPWISAKLCFELFGFKVPEKAPKAGREFVDESGLFRVRVVDSDHYYPLRSPGKLDRQLYP
jgi:hypothetical protein